MAAEETPADSKVSSQPPDLSDTSASADISLLTVSHLNPDTDTSPAIDLTAQSNVVTSVKSGNGDELLRGDVGAVQSHDEGTTVVTETCFVDEERDSDVPKMPLPEVDVLLLGETASSFEETKEPTSELKSDVDTVTASEVVAVETNLLVSEQTAGDGGAEPKTDLYEHDVDKSNDPSDTDDRETKDLSVSDDSETDDP